MKAVILAGGLGTRLSEETGTRPKPMVEVGGKPILWHIMKIYSAHGINEFIICLGYKGFMIKEYFSNYFLHTSDVTFDLGQNAKTIHRGGAEKWKVTLVDTGDSTLTGGRVKRIAPFVQNDAAFCLTYGDGVGNINITELVALHSAEQRLATVTATQPPGRFGALWLDGNQVNGFREKPNGDGSWINGGYFVCSPRVLDYIEGDNTIWEREPLERLAQEGQLSVHRHDGFWQPMDTLHDKNLLEQLWQAGKAPWKTW